MNHLATIRRLDKAVLVAQIGTAWGPSGRLGVDKLKVSDNLVFDLLVPTSPSDNWDYIWESEKEKGSTEKVQLFQSGTRVQGSRVTAISREGQNWNATGPEQYRLTFVVPLDAVKTNTSVEVRFFWDEKLISTAI